VVWHFRPFVGLRENVLSCQDRTSVLAAYVNRDAVQVLTVRYAATEAGKLQTVPQDTLCGAFLTYVAKLRSDDREQALLLWKRKGKRAFESEL
jgi:hypothetical protein